MNYKIKLNILSIKELQNKIDMLKQENTLLRKGKSVISVTNIQLVRILYSADKIFRLNKV